MSNTQWGKVDGYINDLFAPHDQTLEAALEAGHAGGLPAISVTPSQGKLLYLLARLQCAGNILEIGTLGGYSTIWLARGLEPGGRLITLEAEAKHADIARENIARAGFAKSVDVRLGKAIDSLPQIQAEGRGPFDLIFIDADKAGYPEYFEWALKLSRKGTVIIGDNVVRDGAVIDAENTDPSIVGIRRFNELIAAEPRVTATVIQTVGSKGYDGFVFVLVTDPA